MKQLGKYPIERKLGKGGMGEVWLGHHPDLDIPVAIKTLSAHLVKADAGYAERFTTEARTAARLNHSHIVRVFDYGTDGDTRYIVMEYVDGGTVGDRLRALGGPMPLDVAIRVITQVAEALAAAQEFRIIHRDIKPDNIMLTTKGVPKLADLGLAKCTDGTDSNLTGTGITMGSPFYMAPEQARDAKSADTRSDLYALGVTFFHLATGSVPFTADSSMGVILAHQMTPTPNPRDRTPTLPASVAAVICKLMEKDPDRRYQSPEELLEDMRRLADPRAAARDLTAFSHIASADTSMDTDLRERLQAGAAPKGAGSAASERAASSSPHDATPDLAPSSRLLSAAIAAGTAPSPSAAASDLGPTRRETVAGANAVKSPPAAAAGAPSAAAPSRTGWWIVGVLGLLALILLMLLFLIGGGSGGTPTPATDPDTVATAPAGPANAAGPTTPAATSPIATTPAAERPDVTKPWVIADLDLTFCPTPPGRYRMGSSNPETPAHLVRISPAIWVSATEITYSQFMDFATAANYQTQAERGETVVLTLVDGAWTQNPDLTWRQASTSGDHPVCGVTWEDATAFCYWLTVRERLAGRLPDGYVYRLPTEAEWEFAARAGTVAIWYTGDRAEDVLATAWLRENAGGVTHQVRQKSANPWGLYDMIGNVSEWCLDRGGPDIPPPGADTPDTAIDNPVGREGPMRVFRGSSGSQTVHTAYLANREFTDATVAGTFLGFRPVLAPAIDIP